MASSGQMTDVLARRVVQQRLVRSSTESGAMLFSSTPASAR